MSNVRLGAFASYYKVTSLSGLAAIAVEIAGRENFPYSMEAVLKVIGVPLQPTTLSLVGSGLTAHPQFTWADPGANSPIAAASWNWMIVENVSGGAHDIVLQGTVQTPYISTVTLKTDGGSYFFYVTPINQFGAGPAVNSAAFETPLSGGGGGVGGGGQTPTPTLSQPSISVDGTVTVSGSNFNASNTVYLRATVLGGPTTPNLDATNSQDARSQSVQTNANAAGKIQASFSPQNFPIGAFSNGEVAYMLAGETIDIVGANANVGNFNPGTGVSAVVQVKVTKTISA